MLPITARLCEECVRLNKVDLSGSGVQHCALRFDEVNLRFTLRVPGKREEFTVDMLPILKQLAGIGS